MNRFERKFVIIDIIMVACFYGYLINTIFFYLSPLKLIVALLVIAFYHLFLKKAVWNNIETQERVGGLG
ncbi:hypothetical protein CMI43_03310 [Candidatus Pacearchaeota archaeon]|nr:hypothetical protein [Candidatus Pacearchaeota archaeon]|tara:strand:+ start:1124 stop:1330 length:207 start_codon:yes stop_codon:yes gene_type:complete